MEVQSNGEQHVIETILVENEKNHVTVGATVPTKKSNAKKSKKKLKSQTDDGQNDEVSSCQSMVEQNVELMERLAVSDDDTTIEGNGVVVNGDALLHNRIIIDDHSNCATKLSSCKLCTNTKSITDDESLEIDESHRIENTSNTSDHKIVNNKLCNGSSHSLDTSDSASANDSNQIEQIVSTSLDASANHQSDDPPASAVLLNNNNKDEEITIDYRVYENELQMPDIMRLIQKDLSEPYSIYTYRYFIHNWPKLCFLAMHGTICVGAIVCKLDIHRQVIKRGYIAMLAVDKDYRKLKIGTNLVQKAIQVHFRSRKHKFILFTMTFLFFCKNRQC